MYEILDEYVGKCRECKRKYACSERETTQFLNSKQRYIICPFCGEKVQVFEKGE